MHTLIQDFDFDFSFHKYWKNKEYYKKNIKLYDMVTKTSIQNKEFSFK